MGWGIFPLSFFWNSDNDDITNLLYALFYSSDSTAAAAAPVTTAAKRYSLAVSTTTSLPPNYTLDPEEASFCALDNIAIHEDSDSEYFDARGKAIALLILWRLLYFFCAFTKFCGKNSQLLWQ